MADTPNTPSAPPYRASALPTSGAHRSALNAARVAASIVDALAILVLGALAWKYERWVPYLIGAILLVAGVRIGDIRNALAGRDLPPGGNGAASLLLALFAGPWWHR